MDTKNYVSLYLICLFFLITACESAVMREYNTHMSGNDYRSARQLLESELSSNPNSTEANYLMGNLLSLEKEYEEANIYFEQSLNASSMYREHIEYLKERNYRREFNEGLNAWDQERLQQTLQQMNYASQIFPDRVEVYPILGNAYEAIGQPDDAQQAYLNCLAFQEDNFQCGSNLAQSYYDDGQYIRAIDTSNEFLNYYPSNANFKKISAYSHLEIGDIDTAEEMFDSFLGVRNNYEALKQFAVDLNNMGEIYRAERYFRRCLEWMPRDQDVLSALSYIYLETRNFRLMVEANERLVSLEPENRLLKENLMLSYELYGDIDNYKAIKSELGLD